MINSLIGFAINNRWVRRFLEIIRFRKMSGYFLKKYPLKRRIADSNIIYRMSSLDSLLVSREVFAQGAYGDLSNMGSIQTFADLGSNCGYFACWLAATLHSRNIRGIMIEGNPEMVAESKWHVETNNLAQVQVCWGLVGGDINKTSETFYIHPSAAGSSRFAKSPEEYITQHQWKPIEVPNVSLTEEWTARFGNIPCDLLKIDIEGSELDFLNQENSFLKNVGLLFIEIHHWVVDTAQLEKLIAASGFIHVQTLTADPNADVRIYKNTRA